jgi:hypothetical protein
MTAIEFLTDDELIDVMLGPEPELAKLALRAFEMRHYGDPVPNEPAHCAECFEGCAKCQPEARD